MYQMNDTMAMAPQFDLHNHFWKTEDGKIWSTAEAKFVTAKVAKAAGYDEVPDSPVDAEGKHSIKGLQEALVFYGLPRGELATEEDIRKERDERIAATDWMMLPDAKVADLEAVKEYRQKLRDITKQSGFPGKVVWPELGK